MEIYWTELQLISLTSAGIWFVYLYNISGSNIFNIIISPNSFFVWGLVYSLDFLVIHVFFSVSLCSFKYFLVFLGSNVKIVTFWQM